MLTNAGAKLLDFGLAKPAMAGTSSSAASTPVFSAAMTLSSHSPQSPLTTSGALVGTVQYMAPEQFQGKDADARSDIFAFGSMLYEMATGKRPFLGKTQIKVVSAILEDDPRPLLVSILARRPRWITLSGHACRKFLTIVTTPRTT